MLRMSGGSTAVPGSAARRRRGLRNQSSIIATSTTGPASHARKVETCINMKNPSFAADLQHGQEGFLWNLHRTDLFHAFFAGLLFFEQLALARDVATIALGEHIFAQRLHSRARDYVRADRRLHRHLEHLAWYQ